jgi:hypothetical protein
VFSRRKSSGSNVDFPVASEQNIIFNMQATCALPLGTLEKYCYSFSELALLNKELVGILTRPQPS